MFVDAYDVLLMPSAANGGLRRRFEAMGVDAVISGETGCWPDPGVAPLYPWPHYDRQPHFGDLYEPRSLPHDAGEMNITASSWGDEEAATEAAMSALEEERKYPRVASHDNNENIDHEKGMPRNIPFPYPNSGGYIARAEYMHTMIGEVMDDVRSGHVDGGGTMGDADDQRWLQRHWLRHPREVAIDTYSEIFLSLHRCCPTAVGSTLSDYETSRSYHNKSIAIGDGPRSLGRQLKIVSSCCTPSPLMHIRSR
jgi:hypothetical protein